MLVRRAALVASALALVLALASPAGAAPSAMRLDDPITDNYKASYNADPSVPESRTWLSMRSVTAAGTTWRPADPSSIVVTSGGAIALHGDDGRAATLRAQLADGSFTSPLLMRSDPTTAESGGRWGPLVTLADRSALRATPGRFTFALIAADGSQLAGGNVTYRYDAALAGAASSSIEYNGPGGRWWVGYSRTRTNWEATPATLPSVLASDARPRITSVSIAARTASRWVTMRVRSRGAGARIASLRVRVDSGRWTRWIAAGSGTYRVHVGARSRRHTVRVQVRDATGRSSTVVARSVAMFAA